ncbi:MsnO8 family LLM class oxidoreductase [Actinoallomurus acaciae]|uniref:MsnO8 family LLM class oxidoreductase n=1 Tax=Actinoallomurus acaciae TaxID=502577 RepID=A0ABV5YDA2_9ACTN
MLALPVIEAGRSLSEKMSDMTAIAAAADDLGYHRIWYPEHHSAPGMADFPPAVMIAHAAAVTSRIRVGSGGVLAPFHVPLSVAEQFGALTLLHPRRIDIGIGRGPGTFDKAAIRALRRERDMPTREEYAADVAEVLRLMADRPEAPEPWMLASSVEGAGLAAELGLPLSFAHHIRPDSAAEAIERYRTAFRPSLWAEASRVMVSVTTVCADTDAQAERLLLPFHLTMAAIGAFGAGPAPLPTPAAAAEHMVSPKEEPFLHALRAHSAVGAPETVIGRLEKVARVLDADELILSTPVDDANHHMHSLELVARGWKTCSADNDR